MEPEVTESGCEPLFSAAGPDHVRRPYCSSRGKAADTEMQAGSSSYGSQRRGCRAQLDESSFWGAFLARLVSSH